MGLKRELVGVPMSETGMVRLFWLGETISVEALRLLMQASHMDPKHVDVIQPEELGEGGLYNYMVEGLGLRPQDIDRGQIDALRGTVYLIRTPAFKGFGQNLQMVPPLRYIGEYKEPGWFQRSRLLRAKSAQGEGLGPKGAPRKSNAAISGRVAMIALGVMLMLTALMLWIAR